MKSSVKIPYHLDQKDALTALENQREAISFLVGNKAAKILQYAMNYNMARLWSILPKDEELLFGENINDMCNEYTHYRPGVIDYYGGRS